MAVDMDRVRQILADAETLSRAGQLTIGAFAIAYADMADALGDGLEAEGMEAIELFAEDESWIDAGEDLLTERSRAARARVRQGRRQRRPRA